jgi:hypothetical protein
MTRPVVFELLPSSEQEAIEPVATSRGLRPMLSLELARTIHDERQREIGERTRIAALLRRPASLGQVLDSPANVDAPAPQRRAKLSPSDRPG